MKFIRKLLQPDKRRSTPLQRYDAANPVAAAGNNIVAGTTRVCARYHKAQPERIIIAKNDKINAMVGLFDLPFSLMFITFAGR